MCTEAAVAGTAASPATSRLEMLPHMAAVVSLAGLVVRVGLEIVVGNIWGYCLRIRSSEVSSTGICRLCKVQ